MGWCWPLLFPSCGLGTSPRAAPCPPRYLLPCSHVMLSQKRAVRDLDIYGKTAAKFLSLIPRCCRPESMPPPEREEEHAAWSKGTVLVPSLRPEPLLRAPQPRAALSACFCSCRPGQPQRGRLLRGDSAEALHAVPPRLLHAAAERRP